MYLKADVFTSTKGPSDSTKFETNPFNGEVQTSSHLFLVLMQPLCGYKDLDPLTIGIGECHCRFSAKEGLILHANDVVTFHNNVANNGRIATDNPLLTDEIPVGVNWFKIIPNSQFGIKQNGKNFVDNCDCCKCTTTCLGVIGCNCSNGFSHVPHDILGKDRLVRTNQSVRELSRYIVCSNNAFDSGNFPGS